MKKFLVLSAVLAFLFMVGPAQASWVNDVVEEGITYSHIGIKCVDGMRIITLKTEAGVCKEYRVVNDKVISMRNCGAADWKGFVKK